MTKITGHRGARNIWPENSPTGFRNAVALGCDFIEFDVHLTTSGELVVIHDPTLERTTESLGVVADLTPEARRKVRLTGTDDTLPTLDEVLELLKPGKSGLRCEIKHGVGDVGYPGITPMVIDRLRAHDMAGRSYLTSFGREILEECRTLAPEIPRVNSINEDWVRRAGGLEKVIEAARGLVTVLAVHHKFLAENWEAVTALWPKEKLGVWTVNDEPTMRHFFGLEVGYLTSDQPDLALRIRQEVQGIPPLTGAL